MAQIKYWVIVDAHDWDNPIYRTAFGEQTTNLTDAAKFYFQGQAKVCCKKGEFSVEPIC